MEFHQLKYFVAVARAGSFVRAAEEEGITQPSLSQQIRKLEGEVGAPLFDRLGRALRLTRYGEALLPEAEEILKRANLVRRTLDSLRSENTGALAIGVIPTILPYSLATAIADFRALHPQVEMQVRELTTDKLIPQVRSGELDLAILALPIRHPEIVCSELFREPLAAALPPSHPLSSRASVEIRDLQHERMLLLREGHCLRDDVLAACNRARTPFHNVFESDHLASIFSMVAAGFGVSLVPSLAAAHCSGCRVLRLEPNVVRRIGYAQAAGHTPLPVQRMFVRFLRQRKWIEA